MKIMQLSCSLTIVMVSMSVCQALRCYHCMSDAALEAKEAENGFPGQMPAVDARCKEELPPESLVKDDCLVCESLHYTGGDFDGEKFRVCITKEDVKSSIEDQEKYDDTLQFLLKMPDSCDRPAGEPRVNCICKQDLCLIQPPTVK